MYHISKYYIFIYKQDIYFLTSYISVSSLSLRGFGRNRNITRYEINVLFLIYIDYIDIFVHGIQRIWMFLFHLNAVISLFLKISYICKISDFS